jgi:hypothetical protein
MQHQYNGTTGKLDNWLIAIKLGGERATRAVKLG